MFETIGVASGGSIYIVADRNLHGFALLPFRAFIPFRVFVPFCVFIPFRAFVPFHALVLFFASI